MNHADYYGNLNRSGGWRRYGKCLYAAASLILYVISLVLAYRYTGAGFAIAGGAGMCAFLCSAAGLVYRERSRGRFGRNRAGKKEKIAKVAGASVCGMMFILLLCTFVSGFMR